MRRGIVFGLTLMAGLAIFFVAIAWYSTTGYPAPGVNAGYWGGMMGGMTGNNYYGNSYSASLQYLWMWVLAAIGLAALGAIGFIYYIAYPQITLARPATTFPSSLTTPTSTKSPPVAIAPSRTEPSPSISRSIGEGAHGETVSPASITPQRLDEPVQKPVSWPILMRTTKPDEKKVLEVLASHNGKYLQKYIAKESGLSKLRTHRIVARFVERGIVTAARSGNTNEVYLADWLTMNLEPK